MQVRDGMTEMALTVGPGHTLRETARLMSARKVGAAVVIDPDAHGPGIITERDILHSIGAGHDPTASWSASTSRERSSSPCPIGRSRRRRR